MAVTAAQTGVHPVGVARPASYVPELESIRGIAMLLVLFFHLDALVRWSTIPRKGYDVPLSLALVRGGDAGVSLFFCLSAFLLAMPFLGQAAGGIRVDIREFAVRRALRILPLYYAACLVAIGWTFASLSAVPPTSAFLLFPAGIPILTAPMKPFSDVWWSLHTEAWFYLTLPVLGAAVGSRRAQRRTIVGLAAFAVICTCYEARLFRPGGTQHEVALGFSLFGQAPNFLWGIAASAIYLHKGPELRNRFASSLRNGGADLALVTVLLVLSLLHQWRLGVGLTRAWIPPLHSFHMIDGFLWSLLILVILLCPLRLKGLVHNRVLENLGVLSYSIYLVHMPILFGVITSLRRLGHKDLVGWNAKTVAVSIAALGLTYGISRLTYHFIEQPFLKRKKLLSRGTDRVPVRNYREALPVSAPAVPG